MASSSFLRLSSKSYSRLSSRSRQPDAKTSFQTFLANEDCYHLIWNKTPVYIPSGESVQSACKLILRQGVITAPVENDESDGFVGVFSYRSLASFLLQNYNRPAPSRRPHGQTSHVMPEFDFRLLMHSSLGPEKPARDFLTSEELIRVRQEEKMAAAAHHFKRGRKQVFLFDEKDDLLGVITVIDMLASFFHRFVRDVDRAFSGTVCQQFPNSCRRSVYTVSEDTMVYDVLSLLHSRHLPCVAVTSKGGRLVGAVSLADFVEIFRTKQHRILSTTVYAFVVHMRTRTMEQAVPTVNRNSRASQVIRRMLASPRKVVWIIDSKQRPVGIIYPTDVVVALSS